MQRPTLAEIHLGAIAHNLRSLRSFTGPSVGVIAVVKADAYGHGAAPVCRVLGAEGVKCFAVATLEEAVTLRDSGIPGRLLILGVMFAEQAAEVVARGFETVVGDMGFARRLNEEARKRGTQAAVHLKFDTGMGRIGFPVAQASGIARAVAALPGLRIEAAMTHLASADEPDADDFTRQQIGAFRKIREETRAAGLRIPMWHAANSPGTLWHPDSHFDAIRPGLALYGARSSLRPGCPVKLRQAMTFKTKIALVRDMPAGATIGYGRTFRTSRASRIAVLPVGYADGFSRFNSNRGCVLIRCRRAPVVGRVCMDLTMADVTDIADASVGDDAVLYGRQGTEEILIAEVADTLGTAPQDVMTSVSARVPRVYLGASDGDKGGAPTR